MTSTDKNSPIEPRELLGMIAFFSEALDGNQLDKLAAGARRRTFAKGEALTREDEPGASMFVIESGEVSVRVENEPDLVAELYAGDVVGEVSLLTGQSRTATVTAAESVVAIEIDKAALAPILAAAPALVERFAEMLEKRQEELAHIHGGGAWGMMLPGDAETHHLIRAFYGAA
ncbi:MAG: cyclic nucleotide-binding domain-containing protein [Bauldia sp.]